VFQILIWGLNPPKPTVSMVLHMLQCGT